MNTNPHAPSTLGAHAIGAVAPARSAPPPPLNPLDRAHAALVAAHEITTQIDEAIDRLTGPNPADPYPTPSEALVYSLADNAEALVPRLVSIRSRLNGL